MIETAVTTGKARLSYEHLFQPYAPTPGQDPKYSVTILVPKSDVATKQNIDNAIAAAKAAGVNKCWGGTMPTVVAVPVYDGDGVRPNGDPFGAECKGHWVFTASSKQAPSVVDTGLNPVINPTEIYSGCYARVNVNFFPYNQSGKRGIGCGLNAVQKLEDGEPLGGRISAEEAFGAPQTAQAAQATYLQSGYPQNAYPQAAPAQPQLYTGYPQAAVPTVDPITGLPYGS